jgi:DNA-binding NarL/FixJ family response regulator
MVGIGRNSQMVGRRPGRFSWKEERKLISMAANGATASKIAAQFKTSVKTVERKARALGVSIKRQSKR